MGVHGDKSSYSKLYSLYWTFTIHKLLFFILISVFIVLKNLLKLSMQI